MIVFLTALLIPALSGAPQDRSVVVGIKEAPPFATKNADGKWEGISVDLWRGIAEDLKLQAEFREMDLKGMLAALEDGSLDVAVGALTVTADREKAFDFSHPFTSTGLGIAVVAGEEVGWLSVLKGLFSMDFFEVALALGALFFLTGLFAWFFERKKNPEQFGGTLAQGMGAGFWWSAVTMTTVGYGDKTPVTLGGRAVALVWMFASIILISGFTAAIASALTVSRLESPIQSPSDLPEVRVGTVGASTSETYLKRNRIAFRTFETPEALLEALGGGKVDAAVYDAPILQHLSGQEGRESTRVLNQTFDRQDYAFGLKAGSPLREQINQSLLIRISRPEWADVLYRYLGR